MWQQKEKCEKELGQQPLLDCIQWVGGRAQLCLTLCDSMEPTKLLCPRDSPCKNTGVGCHFLLQEIVPTQESNLCLLQLLHCRWILYRQHQPLGCSKTEHDNPGKGFVFILITLPPKDALSMGNVSLPPPPDFKLEFLCILLLQSQQLSCHFSILS